MSKTYKGYELIKAIENKELEDGQKLIFKSTIAPSEKIVEVKEKEEGLFLIDTETNDMLRTGWLINATIEILEDEETIDIEECHINITCSELDHNLMDMQWYINKVLLPVINKQQKQINKLEERNDKSK